jgi:hypothetical protein
VSVFFPLKQQMSAKLNCCPYEYIWNQFTLFNMHFMSLIIKLSPNWFRNSIQWAWIWVLSRPQGQSDKKRWCFPAKHLTKVCYWNFTLYKKCTFIKVDTYKEYFIDKDIVWNFIAYNFTKFISSTKVLQIVIVTVTICLGNRCLNIVFNVTTLKPIDIDSGIGKL